MQIIQPQTRNRGKFTMPEIPAGEVPKGGTNDLITIDTIGNYKAVSRWRGVDTLLTAKPMTRGSVDAMPLLYEVVTKSEQAVGEIRYTENGGIFQVTRGYGVGINEATLEACLFKVTRTMLQYLSVNKFDHIYCPNHPQISLSGRLMYPMTGTNGNHYGWCFECKAVYVGIPASYVSNPPDLILFRKQE